VRGTTFGSGKMNFLINCVKSSILTTFWVSKAQKRLKLT
jgi:hypothetical protein